MANLTEQAFSRAKEWVPWKPGLPWWIVLVEGIALAIMGILLVINPATSSINVAIGLTILLTVLGVIELWAVFRNRLSPRIDGAIAARGAIVTYAGIAILLMLLMDINLSLEAGRVLFGLAATVFGILGLFAYFGGARQQLRGILVDSVFFLLVGLVVLYTQWQGGDLAARAILWLGWLSIIIGLGLVGFAFWRRQRSKEPEDVRKIGESADPNDVAVARLKATVAATKTDPSEERLQRPAAGISPEPDVDSSPST